MSTPFEFQTLDNGLRLVVVPMSSTQTVTVLVLVGTGSRYETKEVNGISHFLEHMMFKGTKKRPGIQDISYELDSIGADYNAFTGHEYTGYYIKSSADKFDKILDVISDIFLNSVLDENEIAKEKGVIVEEINMDRDIPTRHIGDLYLDLLYGDQPLGWPIAGEKEEIVKFTKENFQGYFNSHYFAQNTIVAVAGAVEYSDVVKKVSEAFSSIRQGEKLKFKPVLEKQDKPAVKIFTKKTDQSHFSVGVRTFGMLDDHEPALHLMSVILGGGMSSRLWDEIREKRGMAYYVYSMASSFLDAGSLATRVGVDNTKVVPALEIILNEYKKLKEEKVLERELRKAKDFIKGKTAIGLESSDDLADFYAEQQLLRGEVLTPEQKLEKIEQVTAGQIQEIAREIFVPEKLNLALIGPFKEDEATINAAINLW